jgi:hypothetical protein
MSLATTVHGKTSPATGAAVQNWSASQHQQLQHQQQQPQQSQHRYSQPEHQQNSTSTSNTTTTAGRRILPSPVLKQVIERIANIKKLAQNKNHR